jgi:hypothetical protein
MPYRVFADTDVLNAADVNAVTADPDSADVTTEESTTSSSYVDLTTVGPSRTLSLVSGQKALVIVECVPWGATDGTAYMSFAVSGAALTQAATDANAAQNRTNANDKSMCTRVSIITATATGTCTVTSKYRCTAGTANFFNRRLIVKKF